MRDEALTYLGTVTSLEQIADDLGLSEEDALAVMLDASFDQCEACHEWVELSELHDDDGEHDGFCANCRPANV